MKILKKGQTLVAYRDETDTELNHQIKVGDSLGRISIKTGKFMGNTAALIPLNEALEQLKKETNVKNAQLILGIDLVGGEKLDEIKQIMLNTLSKFIVGNGNYHEAITLKRLILRDENDDVINEIELN